MARKQVIYKIKGMSQDQTQSLHNAEFSFENMNIRFTSRENNSLMGIENEKGTSLFQFYLEDTYTTLTNIEGIVIGHVTINNQIVLFTNNGTNSTEDRIYLISNILNTKAKLSKLFQGNLNFSISSPIETLSFYENEEVQKVYWIDNRNQPRVINIKNYVGKSFDFLPLLSNTEQGNVTKLLNAVGSFPAGTVQYCCTYVNKFLQESNIFYYSPILTITNEETGGEPNDIINNNFRIELSNLDTSFDYVRIYSIIKTSTNSLPIVKKVIDISNTSSSLQYIDNNNYGELQDSTKLLYVGGDALIANSMTQKDNTLFLGNISLQSDSIEQYLNPLYKESPIYYHKEVYLEQISSIYDYKSPSLSLSSSNKYESYTTFKGGETYRFGLQFKDKVGKWSEVVYLEDVKNLLYPNINNNIVSAQAHLNHLNSNIVKAKVILQKQYWLQALNAGYTSIRGVVVYPKENERNVLAQGVLNPVLYNLEDRSKNSPDIISSWYFRPFYDGGGETTDTSYYGRRLESRHNYSLPKANEQNAEVQNATGNYTYPGARDTITKEYILDNAANDFFIDSSIATFNSPDVEFNDSIQYNLENTKLRIIGYVGITGMQSNLSITYTGGLYKSNAEGFVPHSIKYSNWYNIYEPDLSTTFFNKFSGRALAAGAFFNDVNGTNKDSNEVYYIYPWHNTGSLNSDGEDKKAVLDKKRMANLRYSDFSYNITPKVLATNKIHYYNSSEYNTTIKIDSPLNSNLPDLFYRGNVDKLLVPIPGKTPTSYPLYRSGSRLFGGTPIIAATAVTPKDTPIRIQYKSTPHLVIPLNWDGSFTQRILPNVNNSSYGTNTYIGTPVWLKNDSSLILSVVQDNITISGLGYNNTTRDSLNMSGLWLAEVYRDDSDIVNRFGGTSPQALASNTWNIASKEYSLIGKDTITIEFDQADTYYQRYDCLKTYGELEQQQSMVEILSYMCETRINLDARTDKNRGLEDNRLVHPNNFNLFNGIYNSKQQYFNPKYIDISLFPANNFPNTFIWSQNKQVGALVDTWTNIGIENSYDTQGQLGTINSLKLFNDQLIGLQDKGLFNILFNSRVQLNTSDGLPIELANSGKVDGVRYLSTQIGTKNKYSVQVTPSGLFFIDDEAQTINLFNGQINILSDTLGFRTWMKKKHSYTPITTINNTTNFFTYYDKGNKDVYFVNKDYTLCYSELLQTFTSFYSYNGNNGMFNIGNSFVSLTKDSVGNKSQLWEHFTGQYDKLYNTYKPFYIKYLFNPEPHIDKIFDTLEIRADVFNSTELDIATKPISHIIAETEYQYIKEQINDINFRQKFRVWRALIPRANSFTTGVLLTNPNRLTGMDRIRNPWAFITLSNENNTDNNRVLLQDVTLSYTI